MHACSLGMSLDNHKQLLGVIFLSSSLSAIFLVLSGSLGSSFQSSSQKAGALVTPFCCTSVCLGPAKGQTVRESNKIGPILPGGQPHQSEGKVLLP